MTLARCHDPEAGERRLLILDDEELVGILIDTIGRLAGFATRVTTTPQACLAEAQAWQPQFIVLDLTLPTTTGEEVLRSLADAGCRARIVISSGADQARLDAALQLGREAGLSMGGSLPKPFSPAMLRALLCAPTH